MRNRLDWVRFDPFRFEIHRIILHYKFCMYINHHETYGFFRAAVDNVVAVAVIAVATVVVVIVVSKEKEEGLI